MGSLHLMLKFCWYKEKVGWCKFVNSFIINNIAKKRYFTFYKVNISSDIYNLIIFVINSVVLNFFVKIYIIIK